MMTQIQVKSRVGPDGVLHLDLPVGREEADREVLVTVQSLDTSPRTRFKTQEEWRAFVDRTAGSWQGEPFERPEQGEYEKRDEWT